MKCTLTLKVLIITFSFFILKPIFGQKKFGGVKEKYTFKVDTTYWIISSPEKVARKLKYDKESKGVEPKYEYIFCKNNNEIVDEPFFSIIIIPTSSNAYEETKINFSKRAQVKLAKVDSMIGNHGRKLTEALADDEAKAIIYTIYNSKAPEPYYSYNVIYCRDKYILMYVFGAKKEDFLKAYEKFTQVVLSTRF